jgi:hypothetical protein
VQFFGILAFWQGKKRKKKTALVRENSREKRAKNAPKGASWVSHGKRQK